MHIYLLRNLVNGKCYVGQTCRPVEVRFSDHRKSAGYVKSRHRYVIARAIHNYGWDNFECSVIEECPSQFVMDERERYWISHYNSVFPNGYNADIGGKGKGRVSENTKCKIGSAHRGKHVSSETRARISKSKTGVSIPKTEEHKKKIGAANSGENSGSAKLTWELVRVIRSRYQAGGVKQKDLANEFGVTQCVISLIVRNLIWVEQVCEVDS